MHKGKSVLAVGLLLASLFIMSAAQALDGIYRGKYGDRPVTASLDILKSSLTGTLAIGKEKYLLEADDNGGGKTFKGKMYGMANGNVLAVEIKLNKNKVHFLVTGNAKPMKFDLQKSDE